jgi:hypothetical protein
MCLAKGAASLMRELPNPPISAKNGVFHVVKARKSPIGQKTLSLKRTSNREGVLHRPVEPTRLHGTWPEQQIEEGRGWGTAHLEQFVPTILLNRDEYFLLNVAITVQRGYLVFGLVHDFDGRLAEVSI